MLNLAFQPFFCTFATHYHYKQFMDAKNNKYIAVTYQLYVDGENGKELVEKTQAGKPFSFISGFGVALDAFEAQLTALEKGQDFSFALTKEQAYGDYEPERVLDLEREMFCIDGRFDQEHIYPEAIVPLQNEEGARFYGRVIEVGPEKVKIDLNHPLAGETLYFEGNVVENREATKEEIDQLIARMTGGCSGCNGGCSGGCDKEGCGGCCGE